jgi:hypothetical protein
MRKCRQKTFYERFGLSFIREEMVSAKSLVTVWGLPHLGSSYGEVLPSAKRLGHFFTVERANAFIS